MYGHPLPDPALLAKAKEVMPEAFALGDGIEGDHWWPSTMMHVALERARKALAADARLAAVAPELLSIAQRWAALDGGAWHIDRHAASKAELLADTRAAIAKATGQ